MMNNITEVNYSKRAVSVGASTRQNTPRWVVMHPLSPVTGITYAAVFTGVHTVFTSHRRHRRLGFYADIDKDCVKLFIKVIKLLVYMIIYFLLNIQY